MFNITNSGIYTIISKKDKKYYPGSSKNFKERKYRHFYLLRNNKHHCQHLQYAYNLYGKDNFEFVVIKNNIPENQLLIEEQKLLDIARNEPKKCYTKNYIAGRIDMTPEIREKISKNHANVSGVKNPMFGKGQEMSQNHADFSGKNNPMFGKKHSLSAKQAISQRAEKNPMYDHIIYKFKNRITSEIFEGTRYEFYTKYNLNRSNLCCVISGKFQSIKNWTLI